MPHASTRRNEVAVNIAWEIYLREIGECIFLYDTLMRWAGGTKPFTLSDHVRLANALIALPNFIPDHMELVKAKKHFIFQPKEKKHAQER